MSRYKRNWMAIKLKMVDGCKRTKRRTLEFDRRPFQLPSSYARINILDRREEREKEREREKKCQYIQFGWHSLFFIRLTFNGDAIGLYVFFILFFCSYIFGGLAVLFASWLDLLDRWRGWGRSFTSHGSIANWVAVDFISPDLRSKWANSSGPSTSVLSPIGTDQQRKGSTWKRNDQEMDQETKKRPLIEREATLSLFFLSQSSDYTVGNQSQAL